MTDQKVLIIGASGYVGSRLVPSLLNKGYSLRVMGRSMDNLKRRFWAQDSSIELFEGNVFDEDSLSQACQGCSSVFYLVHSMNKRHKDFEEADRKAAQCMVKAAEDADIRRIIYLGGLVDTQGDLSQHLRSRMEVSDIFHSSTIPTTTLRAAMIIGAASLSFEILRYLVKRLPIMVTPKWVSTESQPIAISNVIGYLVGCLENESTKDHVYDIGGPDIVSYRDLMSIFAEESKIGKRFIIPVPVLTPRLSSYWIHLVTPVSAALARPLADGLRNRLVCQDNDIATIVPQKLLSCREAIRLALQHQATQPDQARWEDFIAEQKFPGDPSWVY